MVWDNKLVCVTSSTNRVDISTTRSLNNIKQSNSWKILNNVFSRKYDSWKGLPFAVLIVEEQMKFWRFFFWNPECLQHQFRGQSVLFRLASVISTHQVTNSSTTPSHASGSHTASSQSYWPVLVRPSPSNHHSNHDHVEHLAIPAHLPSVPGPVHQSYRPDQVQWVRVRTLPLTKVRYEHITHRRCQIWHPNWVRLAPNWDKSGTF